MAQRQRKGPPPKQAGGSNTVFYIVLGVIAVGGILGIAYALSGGAGGGTAATEPVDMEATDARALYEAATPVQLGQEGAPVKIVEFADYQCPGCAAFSLGVKPRLMPYIANGDVQLVYYDFPLGGAHIHAFLASRAARCAGEQQLEGEDAYWTMHNKLYQEQPSWSVERDATEEFIGYAGEIGLDTGAFEACLRSDRFAEVVTANRLLGERLGVRSTPTVLVNNRRVGGSTIQAMGDEVIRLVEEIIAPAGDAAR